MKRVYKLTKQSVAKDRKASDTTVHHLKYEHVYE